MNATITDDDRATAAALVRRIYDLPDTVELNPHFIHVPDRATAALVQAKMPGERKIYIGAFSPKMWKDKA